MQTLLAELLDSIVSMPGRIADVAAQGPISAVLVVLGTLIFVAAFGVFGYLTLGALVDLVTPDVGGRAPPRAGR